MNRTSPPAPSHPSVILGGAGSARSAVPAQSKDLVPAVPLHRRVKEFSAGTLLATLLLAAFASAQTLTGTVINATTGKPAGGDQVVLLSLGNGMEEAGRTKANAKGNFSFKLDKEGPHLIRVIHQDVTYHRMAPPGTTSVEVEVNDVAKKVDGIEVVADIMRLQVEQGQLEVMRAFAVQNTSKPPRTQMNERDLEFYVPEGAKIVDGSAMTANGNPLSTMPVPVDDKKTRYAFMFPLRPGTTQFEVAYQLSYDGSANIDPKSIYPLQHFVAILPKGMTFTAASGTNYQPMNDPQQPDAIVQVASNAPLGQALAFKISGQGVLEARQENAGQPGAGGQADNRPGGGLGPPIDAPDPLQKYRWWILGGFGAALTIGGVYVASRQQAAARAAARPKSEKAQRSEEFELEQDFEEIETPPVRQTRAKQVRPSHPRFAEAGSNEDGSNGSRSGKARQQPVQPLASSPSSKLLEGLKEELFDLEVEHKQGLISEEEYEQAKDALDKTLQRALRREAAKQA